MANSEPCEKHEMIGCTYCSGKESQFATLEQITPDVIYPLATFIAKYEGMCWGCDMSFEPGDTVTRLSNSSYVHARCW